MTERLGVRMRRPTRRAAAFLASIGACCMLGRPLLAQSAGERVEIDQATGEQVVVDDGPMGEVDLRLLPPYEKAPAPGGSVVDVLVVYTVQRATAGTASFLEASHREAVEELTAGALAASEVPHRFRLAGSVPVSFDETRDADGDLTDELDFLRESEKVADLRREYDADIVLLAVDRGEGNAAGRAYLAPRAAHAFGVFTGNRILGLTSLVAAHELGHLMGARHHIDPGTGDASFSGRPVHGHVWERPLGGAAMTVMAAGACRLYGPPCEYYPGYSNPSVTLDGVPTGVAGVSEVARLLREVMPQAAQFSETRVAMCSPLLSDRELCLHDGRFSVRSVWRDFNDNTGDGFPAEPRSLDSGLFWFFDEANWELLVKVLDGCGANGRFWVFMAATTNVEFFLTVEDLLTPRDELFGEMKTYVNRLGHPADAVTDIEALATCGSGGGS